MKLLDGIPSWYVTPQQNDARNLYGAGQGVNLEEATKSALANAASRIMVSISSKSELLVEENRFDYNEETRQKIDQHIEKIDFSDFIVSKSKKFEETFYVQVQIRRHPFISSQEDKLKFLEKKAYNLDKNLKKKNLIQKRIDLTKIIEIYEEIELNARILKGVGQHVNLAAKLDKLAQFKNKLNSLNHEIEFYFANPPPKIAKIVKHALNHEGIPVRQQKHDNSITLRINKSSSSNKIYEAHITKIRVDFENSMHGKIIAGNSIEITGSSAISEEESYRSALTSLEEKISKEGILEIIGIISTK